MPFSGSFRLYKEALKQAAVDPSTGRIDISILTTGISGAARKRKAEVAQALKKLIQEKGKVATLKQPKLFEELRERSDLVRLTYTCIFSKGVWIAQWFATCCHPGSIINGSM